MAYNSLHRPATLISSVTSHIAALVAAALLVAMSLCATATSARAETSDTVAATPPHDVLLPYLDARRVVLPASAELRLLRAKIPGFSRQTKLACSACHYGFPQLTPFGRLFKLN